MAVIEWTFHLYFSILTNEICDIVLVFLVGGLVLQTFRNQWLVFTRQLAGRYYLSLKYVILSELNMTNDNLKI